MPINALLLPEFDQEMAVTRRVLERVPDGRGEWKPHPKSFPLAHLAQLVARLPSWLPMTTERTEIDLAPPEGAGPMYTVETTATLLKTFDDNVRVARRSLEAVTDEALQVPWTLKRAGETLLTQPRYTILRGMVMNHIVHHRAQLGVYLRLLDVPVPEMYGPTADEGKAPGA